ncbi:MAG TPA: hypothetical protein VLF91_04025 [Candidatus Saccharimonadales bacterium]|nr:hypothetical protein [Candidatus Saccharimonadales bacterium]
MRIVRYSALEMFGMPIDKSEYGADPERLRQLMEVYSIEPTEVPVDTRDITPYYWRRPLFRYFMSRTVADGPVVMDMMPVQADSAALEVATPVPNVTIIGETAVRSYAIPRDIPGIAIVGPGPRFREQLCVHELIVYRPDS